MTKRKEDWELELEDPERRRVVQGGLLAAAAALGFLPGCADSEGPGAQGAASGTGAASGGAPGAAGSSDTSIAQGSGASGRDASAAAGRNPTSGRAAAGGAANSGTAGAQMASAGTPSMTGKAGASGSAANTAAGGASGMQPMAAGGLPRAVLGKTGLNIPIVGFGTSRLGQRGGTPNATQFQEMLNVLNGALDLGIEYFDTGAVYGRAEEALGQVLAGKRDKVVLVTKLYTDTYAEAKQLFERSLQRLKTDHVDILHLHSTGERNIDTVLSQDGSWRYLMEQKAMGRTRFIGITGHNNPPNFLRMLATDQVDVLMTIMNFVDHSTYGLSKAVREEALKRGVGVMAMKVFGGTESVLRPGGGLANANAEQPHPSNMQLAFTEAVLPDCMRFVKTLGGITGMVLGINSLEELKRNIRWATETQPFSDTEMQAIIKMGETVAPMWAQRYG